MPPPEDVGRDVVADGGVHKMASAKRVELVGLAILKRYWKLEHPDWVVEDVHDERAYFPRGIDFLLKAPEAQRATSTDVKVDTYIGSDPNRRVPGLCNPNSGFLLIETLSQLQYDRRKTDVSGWFYTSEADEIHYYYLALLNERKELSPFFSEIKDRTLKGLKYEDVEEAMIRTLRVDQDLLLTYNLKETRAWFDRAPAEALIGYSGAPNPTYVTVSVRVNRGHFCSKGPGRLIGPIHERVRRTL